MALRKAGRPPAWSQDEIDEFLLRRTDDAEKCTLEEWLQLSFATTKFADLRAHKTHRERKPALAHAS